MLEPLRELQSSLKRIEQTLKNILGRQLQQGSVTKEIKNIVDFYFRNCRPNFLNCDDLLLNIDKLMQSLLEATHRNTLVSRYKSFIKLVQKQLIELEKITLLRPNNALNENIDIAIIITLKKLIPSAACSYEQAIHDLTKDKRLSWRGPATDLREALRETLDHLAPDEEISAQDNFKLEANMKGPTMKQKVGFILRKRGLKKSSIETPEKVVQAVEDTVGGFVRSVYTRSSVSTHTPTDKREVIRIRDWVRVALCELLEIT